MTTEERVLLEIDAQWLTTNCTSKLDDLAVKDVIIDIINGMYNGLIWC